MKESFLQHIWRFKKFDPFILKTTFGKKIQIISSGTHNQLEGPDFLEAKLCVDDVEYCGAVEVHIKSSDWYLHQHHKNPNYKAVILHLVWEHDIEVFDQNNNPLPTLEIKNYISNEVIKKYKNLVCFPKSFIPCENDISEVSPKIIKPWFDELFIRRLKRKADQIYLLLKSSNNDWEEVLFRILSKNFGSKINGASFFSMSKSFSFSVVRKCNNALQLEALFLGQLGLLEKDFIDVYYRSLKQEYVFLKNKFKLKNDTVFRPSFYSLRPSNFPTIRISQLSNLYAHHQNLFSKIVESPSLESYYNLMNTEVSNYWVSHYTFDKESKSSKKKMTKKFADILIINTFIPLLYAYNLSTGQEHLSNWTQLISRLKNEQNGIINRFEKFKIKPISALESQSILELYTNYCSKSGCLNCNIGKHLLYH